MEYCKLQIGCILIVLYIIFIYEKEKRHFKLNRKISLFDVFLVVGLICLLLDGTTAYTVNHPEAISSVLNLILHGLFFISIDAVIFITFLYMINATTGLPRSRYKLLFLYGPLIISIIVVILNLGSLEYLHGRISSYSMGISVYTCFFMVAMYSILTIATVIRYWEQLDSHKRVSFLTCLLVQAGITTYQMLDPDSLISSVGTTMLILGTYMNQEDPAIKELSKYHDEMVMGFATLIETRDDNTGGHVKRTTLYVELLARSLKERGCYETILTKDYIKNLMMAAPMHDVGKVSIPDAILQKPGKLTDEEFEIMKSHAAKGGEIIRKTFSRMGNEQYLEMAYQIARHHHEKWNGKGYPDGLSGEEIPLCARIMAIADVFDAVSEKRCYRDAMPLDKCFEIIAEGSGRDFDPSIARVFLDMRPQVCEIHSRQ